ncbi:MAG: hypothetical protein QOJ42_1780 [Acidobacteriaceae bacterium]|nr:hypothetical protein [Acidobacteriaceae bacterium]
MDRAAHFHRRTKVGALAGILLTCENLGTDVLWPTLMAILWMGAFALYGMSAVYLGALGTSIGWGLFQIFMIMTATLSGLLTAEWRGASRSAMALLGAGMAGLIGATLLLSFRGR